MALKLDLNLLVASGFHPEGKLWARSRDGLVDVIEPQLSRDKQTLTVNLGVAHRSVYWLCWGKEYEPSVGEPFCVARRRLGVLVHGVDNWWPNSDSGKLDAVHAIGNEGLKFLNSVEDENDLLCALLGNAGAKGDPLTPIHSALLRHAMGDDVKAKAELLAISARLTGPWKNRVQEILERMDENRDGGS